jgi:hypothetical protein
MNGTIDGQRIRTALENLNGIDTLRTLFVDELNYDYANQELAIEFPKSVHDMIHTTKLIAEKGDFKVILCTVDTLLKGIELPAVKTISSRYLYNLIVFTNKKNDEFHFVNTKYIGKEGSKEVKGFRRITVGKTDRLRTAAERLSKIYAPEGIAPLELMGKCEESFDVEAVSEAFYKTFVEIYKELRCAIQKENRLSDTIADILTQEITNRLIFLYFIQKKGWLNKEYRFLYAGFKSCKTKKTEYYKAFLVPLFKKLSDTDFHHPKLETIPFLNGGLFEFDDALEGNVTIKNESFERLFEDLLEHFNFTIREDTEFEEEVAIDPEMLGRIFEELILSLESAQFKDIPDPRRASGSYYTPRFVVSFMVKQALFNYLITESPQIQQKDKLKALVFDLSTEELDEPAVIKEKLLALKIVDPGVGSGAFSVDILNKLVNLIEKLNEKLGVHEDRYNLRKKLIEDCIYGVDIQERAVHLARLRLWLSLIVDTEVEDIGAIPPLINLDFKIVKGDSLVSKICGFKFDLETQLAGRTKKTPEQMALFGLRGKYNDLKLKYAEAVTVSEKEKLRKKIDKKKGEIAIWHLESIRKKREKDLKGIGAQRTLVAKTRRELAQEDRQRAAIDQELSDIAEKIKEIKRGVEIDAFNWELNFFEVMDVKGGFDIVIANPPYGVAVDKAVSDAEFGLGSKDSYGVFAALGVNILKLGGTLCYIMSDTWQTIRTHYKLRKKLFEETEAQYLISVPMRTFTATVNTGIYLFKKSTVDTEKDNWVIATDFHGLDIKNGDLENGFEELIKNEPDETYVDGYTVISDREKAIYAYRQKIIKKFSNLSFFIASPKLFKLMDDTTTVTPGNPPVMTVKFNGKAIELVKFGDSAKVAVGLQTGDNDYYLRQLPDTKGSNYKEVDLSLVLKEDELEKIRGNEELRWDIIEKGICTNPNSKVHQHRYFGGRYFVPYDKGGASDIEEGWLPNYYVPTPYFIEWSEEVIKMMKTMTIADNYIRNGKTIPKDRQHYRTQVAAVFRNIDTYFKEGISFSDTGYYAPTYRFNASAVYDVMGMSIFSQYLDSKSLSGILTSNLSRFFIKNFINHTVHSQVEGVKKIPLIWGLPEKNKKELIKFTFSIIKNQKQNLKYNYMTNEQLEIDKLVYEMYNLNEEDIQEVENWYYRRYPKLANAIEAKLKVKNND